jgi:hypothetical protein
MYWLLAIIGFLLLLAFLAWLVLSKAKSRRLSASSARRHADAWKQVLAIQDDHRRIIEAEKVIESALKEVGYEGTFADKLRKAGPRFSDVQGLWNAHKLRNRIAHEMGMTIGEREVKGAMAGFERALKDLS